MPPAAPPPPPPKPAAMPKTNEPSSPALKVHADMFTHIPELLAWKDLENPAAAHPNLFDTWKDSAETTVQEIVKASEIDLTARQQNSLVVVRDITLAALEGFLQAARAVGWAAQPVDVRRAAVDTLLAKPQVPQRTSEWYAQGKQVLTASEFATLFKSPRSVSQLVLSKVLPPTPINAEHTTNRLACLTCEMGPFDWGIRFEPVVKQVLARDGVEIVESGRLVHPTDSLLAASPDGLIVTAQDKTRVGRLVEIKCPITRAVGEGIPFEYWCQMQIQMEVTSIEECEYIEVKLESIQKSSTELPERKTPEGHIWLLQQPNSAGMVYAYEQAERDRLTEKGWDILEVIPWRVEKFYREVVVRDRAWFASTATARASFWTDVEKARAGTYVPVEARPRAAATGAGKVIVTKEGAAPTMVSTSEPVCLFLDD